MCITGLCFYPESKKRKEGRREKKEEEQKEEKGQKGEKGEKEEEKSEKEKKRNKSPKGPKQYGSLSSSFLEEHKLPVGEETFLFLRPNPVTRRYL